MTLVNFLHELEHYAERVLTRQRYVALYPDSLMKQHGGADRDFDAKQGATRNPNNNPAGDFISAESVRHAREQLQRDTQKAVNFANWFVAHRTRHPPIKMTLAEMYIAVNRIFDTYAVYHNIITASVWMGKYPAFQYDWHAPFSFAWMTEDFTPFEPPE